MFLVVEDFFGAERVGEENVVSGGIEGGPVVGRGDKFLGVKLYLGVGLEL